jgi:predicted permease
MLESLGQDVRQAARSLRRAPALTVVVALTLGIALAASVVTFSVLNATLLQRLPYRDPDRVVMFHYTNASCSPPTFVDYRRETRSFETLSAAAPWNANLTGAGEPERVRGLLVSADFFQTLGVAAGRGRTFRPEEEQAGREKVVVVSHGLWERRFGADPGLVGRPLSLDGESYEVVGIMRPGFSWGRVYGKEAQGELWAPFALTPERVAENRRGDEFLDVYGRLRPGVTREQAQADLDAVLAGLRRRFPDRYTEASGFSLTTIPLQEAVVGEMRSGLLLVFAAVASLLLVAATNVAGLLLARAAGRRREASVRAALGASRARLARHTLAEAGLLAVAGGAVGVGLAAAIVAVLERVDRVTLPRAQPIAIDATVAFFALAATALTAVGTGLVPAWQGARADLMGSLRTALPAGGGRDAARTRRRLVTAQTAVALALLVGAGLLVRSLSALHDVPIGFVVDGVLSADVQLPRARYAAVPARAAFVERVLAEAGGRAGVVAVGAVSELPLSGSGNRGTFLIEGRPVPAEQRQPHAELWSATPGYFATLRIPLRHGRLLAESDSGASTPVAVVSQAFVRRYFPNEDPLGRRIAFERPRGEPRWREIVGVVGDVRDRRLDREAGPQLYVPMAQRPVGGMSLVARTRGDPWSALPMLRDAVRVVDADLPLFGATTLGALAVHDTQGRRAARTALAAFALAALGLAGLGLYGLLAQAVKERTAEIGVRMAVGAGPADVIRLFLSEGGAVVGRGVAVGVLLALAGTRLMQGMLYGVTGTDPATYLAVSGVLAAAALLACSLPAWRASRVDPLRALRTE